MTDKQEKEEFDKQCQTLDEFLDFMPPCSQKVWVAVMIVRIARICEKQRDPELSILQVTKALENLKMGFNNEKNDS